MSSDEQQPTYLTGELAAPLYAQPATGPMPGYAMPGTLLTGELIMDGERIHDNPAWLKVTFYVWTGRLSKVE